MGLKAKVSLVSMGRARGSLVYWERMEVRFNISGVRKMLV